MTVADKRAGLVNAHDTGDGEFSTIRVRMDQGKLAPIMLRTARPVTFNNGTATTASVLSQTDLFDLPMPGGLQCTVPVGTAPQSAGWSLGFQGRRLGLWIRGDSSAVTPAKFCVFVNGRLRYSGDTATRQNSLQVAQYHGGYLLPICDDLPDDGPHTVSVTVIPDASNTVSLLVAALMVDERFAPPLPQPGYVLQLPVTLTTSAASIGLGGHSIIRKIWYSSTDTGAAAVVQILDSASTEVDRITIPAATASQPVQTSEYDFGVDTALDPYKHLLVSTPTTGSVVARAFTRN